MIERGSNWATAARPWHPDCNKDDSYDNVFTETTNGLHKSELIRRRAPWKTKESV